MANAIDESESEKLQGMYCVVLLVIPNKMLSMGIIATNEKRLNTVEIKFINKLSKTYFLYGGKNRFNNPKKLTILFRAMINEQRIKTMDYIRKSNEKHMGLILL
jgi:hypothetical protein